MHNVRNLYGRNKPFLKYRPRKIDKNLNQRQSFADLQYRLLNICYDGDKSYEINKI